MIPVATTVTEVSSLEAIDEGEAFIGDARWVMRTQADLYSNRELAVVREYSTNAYDANVERAWIEAGSPVGPDGNPITDGLTIKPVEVALPTMLNPNQVVIRDHGYGMNRQMLMKVYVGFGLSSKRTSNLTNGQLGYGSKSALAYTEQFTVVSIHEGVKTTALIQRRPDWSIGIKIVAEQKTDEDSGTTITVPVHNWEEFHTKAMDFYKFWLPGRVLINGKAPEHFAGDKITEGLYHSNQWNRSYIVMSNAPYVIENPSVLFRNSKMSNLNFVAYVDTVGDGEDQVAAVEFTPSREALKYTDHTKRTLQRIINDFETKIVDAAKADILAAKTHAEAYTTWAKWVETLGRDLFADLEFRGEKFKSEFKVIGTKYQMRGYVYGGAVQRIAQWNVESMAKTLVVTDFDLVVTTKHKNAIKEYQRLKGTTEHYALFIKGDGSEITSPWVSKDNFVSWDDVKAALPVPVKKVSTYNRPKRIKGTFDFYTMAGKEVERPLPATYTNLYYISVQDNKRTSVTHILKHLKDDGHVIILAANRIEKFKRENPSVKEFREYVRSQVVLDGPSLLSDDAKELRGTEWQTRQFIRDADVSRLDDPIFAKLKPLLDKEQELNLAYERNLALASWVGLRYNVKEYRGDDQGFNVYRKYPLLSGNGRRLTDHHYIYINAAYAAEKEKKNV